MSGSLCHVLNGHVDVDPEHVVGDEANEDKDSNMDSPDVGDGDNVKNHDDGGEDDDVDDMTMTRKMTKMMSKRVVEIHQVLASNGSNSIFEDNPCAGLNWLICKL